MDEDRPERPHSPTLEEVEASRKFRNIRIDGAFKPSKNKNSEQDEDEYRNSNEIEFQEEINADEKWKCGTPRKVEDFPNGFSEQATSTENIQAASAFKFLAINPPVSRKVSTSSLPPIQEEATLVNISIPFKKVSFNDLPLSSEKLNQIGRYWKIDAKFL